MCSAFSEVYDMHVLMLILRKCELWRLQQVHSCLFELAHLLAAHDKGPGLKRSGLHCGLLSVTELVAGKSDKQRGLPNPTCTQ